MKCLLFLFTFCIIGRFINGQSDLESENNRNESGETSDALKNDRVDIEDKINEPGKEYSDIDDYDGDAAYRKESGADSPNDDMANDQEGNLESDAQSSSENKQVVALAASKENNVDKKKRFEETMKRFASEMAAGDKADLMGSNPHIHQSHAYSDLGRRFVPQYKYTDEIKNAEAESEDNELIPERAPPELVLVVAKESALLGPDKSTQGLGSGVDMKKILRTGDYWNGVWKEDVKPKPALRSAPTPKKVLGSIKAKIKPGSEFYKVVSRMKKISPRLLYIINKKQV